VTYASMTRCSLQDTSDSVVLTINSYSTLATKKHFHPALIRMGDISMHRNGGRREVH